MKKISRKTNPILVSLVKDLKRTSWKEEAPIWRDIAKRLEGPSRNWAEVNISRIARYVQKDETIIIPGKLLGAGFIDFPVTVAAFRSTASARDKIEQAGGTYLSIGNLMKENPKGSKIRIIG